jgi:prevent-host-death family protein
MFDPLSELVAAASRGRPQVITRHGKAVAVLVKVEDHDRLQALDEVPRKSFVQHLLDMPKGDIEFERILVQAARYRTLMFLLDTVVLSETTKRCPDPSAIARLSEHSEGPLFVSVLSLGEIAVRQPHPPLRPGGCFPLGGG